MNFFLINYFFILFWKIIYVLIADLIKNSLFFISFIIFQMYLKMLILVEYNKSNNSLSAKIASTQHFTQRFSLSTKMLVLVKVCIRGVSDAIVSRHRVFLSITRRSSDSPDFRLTLFPNSNLCLIFYQQKNYIKRDHISKVVVVLNPR